jgi:hypothetical protein
MPEREYDLRRLSVAVLFWCLKLQRGCEGLAERRADEAKVIVVQQMDHKQMTISDLYCGALSKILRAAAPGRCRRRLNEKSDGSNSPDTVCARSQTPNSRSPASPKPGTM